MNLNFVWGFLFLSLIQYVSCLKILCIYPTISKSHWIIGSETAKVLAEAGHEITMISPFPSKHQIKNYRDIKVDGIYEKVMGNYSIKT